jgi:crossover junction endodeoxyribonuclease RusA
VCITAHPPDNRKRDLDNLQKSLLDSITCAGVWQDDSQIMHLSITMGVKRKDGGVTVRISPGWEPEADII